MFLICFLSKFSNLLTEARAKLQNLEINRKPNGGLSTSMSMANIHRLPLTIQHQKENLLPTAAIKKANNLSSSVQNSSYADDAVRRSISLSDLSHHNQLLGNKNLSIKQQIRNKLNNSNNSNSTFNNVYYPLRNLKKIDQIDHHTPQQQQQGLWSNGHEPQQQHNNSYINMNNSNNHQQLQQQQQERLNILNSSLNTSQNSINQLHNGQATNAHKPIRVRMSRSSSMASIKNDSLLRNLENNKPQGLWNSPSSLSINTLRSNSALTAAAAAQNKFNHLNTKLNSHHHHLPKSSDEEESSSDENDLYHRISQRPSTPPKPNIRQLRRSSTTSNNLFLTNNNNNLISNNTNNSSHSNSVNLTLQQNASLTSATAAAKSAHKPNRKSWSNNFELRPAKSEYNLNSMGQETINSPSSGFWSNHSNNGMNTTTNGNSKIKQ